MCPVTVPRSESQSHLNPVYRTKQKRPWIFLPGLIHTLEMQLAGPALETWSRFRMKATCLRVVEAYLNFMTL